MRKAYVLIDTVEEKAASVASAVRSMRGVVAADIVSGAHSVIAVVECENAQSVARLTLVDIPSIEGVAKTLICRVIESKDQVGPGVRK